MKHPLFSKREAVGTGWEIMKRNLSFFIVILLIAGLIYSIPNIIRTLIDPEGQGDISTGFAFLFFILGLIILFFRQVIQMGFIRIALSLLDGKKVQVSDLFSEYPLFWKFFVGSILYGLIVLFGLLLLVIPGIIWAVRYQYFGYLIVEAGLEPLEALRRSAELTQGTRWDLFLFGLLIGLINILGALALAIGLFATIPTTLVAQASVYRQLKEQHSGN